MELDDLKNMWKDTKSPASKQPAFNPETVEKMTRTHYRSKMKKIILPELAGSAVCLMAAVFIGLSFHKLDTTLLQVTGVLAILLLLLLPVISTLSTWKLGRIGNVNSTYVETLQSFAVQKIRFVKLQKLNITLSYLLLVTSIVLLARLFNGTDLSGNTYYWLLSFTIGFVFLLFYSKWVESHYRKSLRQAEELLQDLAS